MLPTICYMECYGRTAACQRRRWKVSVFLRVLRKTLRSRSASAKREGKLVHTFLRELSAMDFAIPRKITYSPMTFYTSRGMNVSSLFQQRNQRSHLCSSYNMISMTNMGWAGPIQRTLTIRFYFSSFSICPFRKSTFLPCSPRPLARPSRHPRLR